MLNILKNNTLKRTVFAFIILAIVFPAFFLTYYAGTTGRILGLIIIAAIGSLGMYEVLETVGISKPVAASSVIIIVLFVLSPWNWSDFKVIVTDNRTAYSNHLTDLMHFAIGDWRGWLILVAASVVPLIIDQWRNKKMHWSMQQLAVSLMFIIVPIFVKVLWVISIYDLVYICFFLPIAIISDTFAYFGGMLFGKKWFRGAKFAPKTSPKKTWAGFIVGLVFTLIFTILAGYFMHVWKDFGKHELLVAILFGIILAIASPYGDLLFSWFKRQAGKKDYSNLIPGHGGVFDRVDAMSITFVLSGIFILFAVLV